MKKVGELYGIPFYSDPSVPKDTIYMLNPDYMSTPQTKKGKPDMRYGINKMFFNTLSMKPDGRASFSSS